MAPVKGELNLMAALVACHGGKADYRAMVCMLGVSYDTVEGRMRTVKKQAQQMLQEAKDAGRVDAGGKPLNETPAKKRAGRAEDGEVPRTRAKRGRADLDEGSDDGPKTVKRGRKVKVEDVEEEV